MFSFAQVFAQRLGETVAALLLLERALGRQRRPFFGLPLIAHSELPARLFWWPELLPLGSQYAMFAAIMRRRSSVVERALGKGEVGCSIHPGGTIT